MLWVILTALTILMALPLRVQIDLHRGQRRLLRLQAGIGHVTRTWMIESQRTPQGRVISVTGHNGHMRQIRPGSQQRRMASTWLRLLRHCRAARRFLMRHMHPLQLDAQLMLHASSAASTALATGGLRMIIAALPARWVRVARLRILPDFLNDHSTLQTRCIFLTRPGTLILTAGLLLAHVAWQAINREVQSLWNTPSEN